MAMINKEFFVEGIPSELSLFDLPPTQTGVENIRMENVQPTSTISENKFHTDPHLVKYVTFHLK
jgi:hypothetical protein